MATRALFSFDRRKIAETSKRLDKTVKSFRTAQGGFLRWAGDGGWFSPTVGAAAADYVSNAILSGKFASQVPSLSKWTQRYKSRFSGAFVQYSHAGAMTGALAGAIRVLNRREGGSRVATVGIDRNAYAPRYSAGGKQKGLAKVALYAEKLEYGGKKSGQPPRPIIAKAMARFISDVFPKAVIEVGAMIEDSMEQAMLGKQLPSVSSDTKRLRNKLGQFTKRK